jgi:DNA adenine methylase
LRKPRSYAEVYNDLDEEIVNLFRVLRDETQARELVRLLRLTPFAREEYALSYVESDDPVEQARRTVMRAYMGFGTTLTSSVHTGFRASSRRLGTTPAHDWANFPDALEYSIDRLAGVVIENRDALQVIADHDGQDALHYVDPPYPHAARSDRWAGRAYRHEMTDAQHVELAELLHDVRGVVVLSGYDCELYDALYAGWAKVQRDAYADGARPRTETLWLSPAVERARLPLFEQEGDDD